LLLVAWPAMVWYMLIGWRPLAGWWHRALQTAAAARHAHGGGGGTPISGQSAVLRHEIRILKAVSAGACSE
jgi:hypothetical protein